MSKIRILSAYNRKGQRHDTAIGLDEDPQQMATDLVANGGVNFHGTPDTTVLKWVLYTFAEIPDKDVIQGVAWPPRTAFVRTALYDPTPGEPRLRNITNDVMTVGGNTREERERWVETHTFYWIEEEPIRIDLSNQPDPDEDRIIALVARDVLAYDHDPEDQRVAERIEKKIELVRAVIAKVRGRSKK